MKKEYSKEFWLARDKDSPFEQEYHTFMDEPIDTANKRFDFDKNGNWYVESMKPKEFKKRYPNIKLHKGERIQVRLEVLKRVKG